MLRRLGNGQLEVSVRPPLVYFDHWALREVSSSASTQEHLLETFRSRGTLMVSLINMVERGVVAVGEPVACLGQPSAHGAQDARLADAGVAGEEHGGMLGDGLAELVHDASLGTREPEIGVGDLLREGRGLEAERAEVGLAHRSPSSPRRRPVARSRSAPAGSNGVTRGSSGASGRRGGRLRWALALGSTGWSGRRWPSCSTRGQ